MANKTIADLTVKNPASSDILPVADPSSGLAGKSTVAQLFAAGLPNQSGNSGKFLTTNGTDPSWSNNPLGTVTSVNGTGTVNGITLTGNITSSGNLTLGGTLSNVNLATQTTGVLSVTNGGTGTTDGSITGTGALTITAGGTNQTVTINPSGTGDLVVKDVRIKTTNYAGRPGRSIQIDALASSGYPGTINIQAANAISNGDGGNVSINGGNPNGAGYEGGSVTISGLLIKGTNSVVLGSSGNNGFYDVVVGQGAGNYNDPNNPPTPGISYDGVSVFIGHLAGSVINDGTGYLTSCRSGIFIGKESRSLASTSINEIVIAANGRGKGSNSTVIGNTNTNAAYIYGNTLNLGNGASAAAITANGALTVTAGGTNQDVTLTPSGTGKVNAPAIKETVFAITDGSSVDINPANGGIQTWTLGANRTPTASSFAEGQSVTLMVDDGTAYAITWSSISPTWIGGSAPTLATSGFTVIELWKRSSTIYGALVGTA
jgi:hypothetical protein